MTFEEFETLLDQALDYYNSEHSGAEIDAGVTGGLRAVRTDAQSLTESQKAQARRNIGAGEGAGGVIASATEPTDPAISVWINTSGDTPVLYVRNTAGVWYPVPGLVGPPGPATGVNPNLLDNWYFGNPVNQRGQTSYNGNNYTIDRWRGTRAIVEVGAQGVALAYNQASGVQGYIYQRIEPGELVGKTVTLSLLLRNNSFATVTGKFPALGEAQLTTRYIPTDGYSINATLAPATATAMPFVTVSTSSPTPVPLLAIKLELGDTQTLAHQDGNGNWVLNEIPDYGEQLAQCQRYAFSSQLIHNYARIGFGVAETETLLHLYFPIPVTLRAQPVVSLLVGETKNIKLQTPGGTYINTTSIAAT